jgi:glycosyltransferase involved in cell wall biosynthesis
MKNQSSITNKINAITVGYVSPGWPLCNFPNGIVAYIQNLLYGLSSDTKPIILAQSLVNCAPRKDLIDLSSLTITRSLMEKISDKIIFSLKLPSFHKAQYRRGVRLRARIINQAIKQLDVPLNILELEESFGTAHFLVKASKVPVVVRLHGPCFLIGPILNTHTSWDFKLRVAYERKAIRDADGITSPSLDVLEKVREYYNLTLPHARVIPNPVLEVDVEKQWQLNSHVRPSVLFIGRFDSVKGGDLMLLAFRIIALSNEDIELIFVGPDKGLLIEGEYLKFNEFIERFIPEASVKKRIRFLGHCDQQRISDLRKETLVTVVCSRYENFPLSLLEALTTGCPTVATAVGGIKEIIINDYNGLLTTPESPEDIAEKVLELIDNPTKMQVLSKNAIKDCKKRFSPQVVASQTIDYYKSVIAGSLQ